MTALWFIPLIPCGLSLDSIDFMENLLLRQQWRMAVIIWILVENQRWVSPCLMYYFARRVFYLQWLLSTFLQTRTMLNNNIMCGSYSWITMAGHIVSTKGFLHIICSRRVGSRDGTVMRVLTSNPLSSAEAPYEKFLNNGGRAGNDGKRHSPRAAIFPSPQAHGHLYRQSSTATRERPLRRREPPTNVGRVRFHPNAMCGLSFSLVLA